ncbi:MAG: Vitamin transporter BtuB precursor [Verrucomicrobiota bacterium]
MATIFGLPALALAAPVDFNLPVQAADVALLAFSRQSHEEVFFSLDDLRSRQTQAVVGQLEPEEALRRLLTGTGFVGARNRAGKFIVTRGTPPVGTIGGHVTATDGTPLRGAQVALPDTGMATVTNRRGEFQFRGVSPGSHRLVVQADGYRSTEIAAVKIEAGRSATLAPLLLEPDGGTTRLAPVIVEGRLESVTDERADSLVSGRAGGNLDLPRTADGPLPYTIYDRAQITRSGVVDLNDFLQREVLESDAAIGSPTETPGEGNGSASFATGSTHLRFRGYEASETVILVNGRRLPEVLTAFGHGTQPPDVNFIPLSLVQQIEVLPVSSSSLYSGNAVGGVVNIVLRPEAEKNATEISTTYNNALGGFDAPQSSLSLMHARSFLGGALRARVSASFTRSSPPVESELGYRQTHLAAAGTAGDPLYRATPNIRSANGSPLFGPGSASFASVAPGANGGGGLSAFTGRAGVKNQALFDSPGGRATSLFSVDYPYGREQGRSTWFGSAVYDVSPALQLGADFTTAQTSSHRGFDVFTADLLVPTAAPGNPFGQDVRVALQDVPLRLGENYGETRRGFSSLVLDATLKHPTGWRLALDGQYAHNTATYRGLAGADPVRWQQLTNDGRYQPFRDTQVHGPEAAFYDQVLIHYGKPGEFVTLGDYTTLDAAVRLTQSSLRLPTGTGVLNVGADYRRTELQDFRDERRYGDGTLAGTPVPWTGRTLQHYSAFGELQAPLVPAAHLPDWLLSTEGTASVRYVAADTAKESNVSPTVGFRLNLAGGFSARATFATASRFPTAYMSRPKAAAGAIGGVGGGGVDQVQITDPTRGGAQYGVIASEALNPGLRPESAVTQAVGLAYQAGDQHHFRLGLDFLDTRKTDEALTLDAQTVVNLETLWPERVKRAADGIIVSVLTGAINSSWRHSQSATTTLDYSWPMAAGGTLELHGRWVQYLRFDRQIFPASAKVDELRDPDAADAALVKHRANLGASWTRGGNGVGLDSQYLHTRALPADQRAAQGSDRIAPYWQVDAFVQGDVSRWLPHVAAGAGLHAQLRVNNVFGTKFPTYDAHPSGAGVQPYGDWRGRTYSLSLTASF